MNLLRILLEDAFTDKIATIYTEKLKGKVKEKPSDFDKDALQLGVIYELNNYKTFKKALAVAMQNLKKDSSCYDDVDDYGKMSPAYPDSQAVWNGINYHAPG